jgi:hypothetical protein
MEQLEFDPPDLSNKPHSRTVVVSEGVDSLPPVVIEVEIQKDGPVSLELLTKLLIVSVVFLATRHIAPSLAIVGAILSAFIPDAIKAVVGHRRWGKKRVGILAVLATLFATLDSAFGKVAGRRVPARVRRVLRPARGLGHAAATTAIAAGVCAIAIAVPTVASGGSVFATSSTPTPPRPSAHTTAPTTPVTPTHANPTKPAAQKPGGGSATPPPAIHDIFRQVEVSATGVPGSVTIARGQRLHLQFTLPQTSKVVLAVNSGTTLNQFSIYRDGEQNTSNSTLVNPGNPYIPAPNLTAGPHTITIEPNGNTAGTFRFTLYGSTDLDRTTDISPDGVTGTVNVTPGQRLHLHFTLAQTSKVVLAVDPASTLNQFAIYTDDEQNTSNSTLVNPGNPYIPAPNLTAGPHTITIEPDGNAAGSLQYVIYASTDLNRPTDISPQGVSGSLVVSPGQRAHLDFKLDKPAQIVLAIGDQSTLNQFSISHDEGQDASNSSLVNPGNPYAPSAILPAGAHTITIEPDGASAGVLVYTLAVHAG